MGIRTRLLDPERVTLGADASCGRARFHPRMRDGSRGDCPDAVSSRTSARTGSDTTSSSGTSTRRTTSRSSTTRSSSRTSSGSRRYAESAYQHISAELKHDLADRVPLVLFKTQSEFQEQNIIGEELPEGVLAFAEPERNRMVLPIDEPPDQLYRLITHELTHVFEFDIIPRGSSARACRCGWTKASPTTWPATGTSLDLMQVRDAALTDNVPKMSEFETQPLSGRLPYSLGHADVRVHRVAVGQGRPAPVPVLAAQERHRRRRERLRRSAQAQAGGVRRAVRPVPQGAVQAVPRQGAAGRLRTQPRAAARRGRSTSSVLSIEPSPTGDMIAAVAGNRKDQELDIILISAKDGQVIRNLTEGFDKDRGFEYIATAGRPARQPRAVDRRGRRSATASRTSRAPRSTRR